MDKELIAWRVLEWADWSNRKSYKLIQAEMKAVFTEDALLHAEKLYRRKLIELKDVLENHAEQKTGNRYGYYGISDDGFWDLRAHIIGLGKAFYESVLADPEIAKKIADERSYVENFGYIFN